MRNYRNWYYEREQRMVAKPLCLTKKKTRQKDAYTPTKKPPLSQPMKIVVEEETDDVSRPEEKKIESNKSNYI